MRGGGLGKTGAVKKQEVTPDGAAHEFLAVAIIFVCLLLVIIAGVAG